MTLWWLTFRGGTAVIVEADSLVHARLLAAVNELGRASQFHEGYPIDANLAAKIPDELIWRMLSREDAGEILQKLDHARPRNQMALAS
jgi:hypothetical protein